MLNITYIENLNRTYSKTPAGSIEESSLAPEKNNSSITITGDPREVAKILKLVKSMQFEPLAPEVLTPQEYRDWRK